MQTVTKRELVQRIAEKTGAQQILAKEVIQAFLDEIIVELARGNRLEFRDFGVFEPKEKAKRVARNPRTGESVNVPAKTTVKFKVGRLMKKKIQNDAQEEAPAAAPESPAAPEPAAAPEPVVTPEPAAAPEATPGDGSDAGSEDSSSAVNPAP